MIELRKVNHIDLNGIPTCGIPKKVHVEDHGPLYHHLHEHSPGVYFIKDKETELVLKVVSVDKLSPKSH